MKTDGRRFEGGEEPVDLRGGRDRDRCAEQFFALAHIAHEYRLAHGAQIQTDRIADDLRVMRSLAKYAHDFRTSAT